MTTDICLLGLSLVSVWLVCVVHKLYVLIGKASLAIKLLAQALELYINKEAK